MAQDRYIPTLVPKGLNEAPPALNNVQEELRKVWEAIHALNGKLGTVNLTAGLAVTGGITSGFAGTPTAERLYVGDTKFFLNRNSSFFSPSIVFHYEGIEATASYMTFLYEPSSMFRFFINATERLSLNSDGQMFLSDGAVGAVPTGGGYFYVSAGALHWVGSAGTDTVVAPA